MNKSTSVIFLRKKDNPKRGLRIDYHEYPIGKGGPKFYHSNIDGSAGIASIANSSKLDHMGGKLQTIGGRTVTLFKYGGKFLFVVGAASSFADIYKADNHAREEVRQVGGWTGAIAGGRAGAWIGVKAGAAIALAAGQAGPQAELPEEALTVPVFGTIGGVVGGFGGGFVGFFWGAKTSEVVYDWAFTPLEKEEWEEVDCDCE